MKYTAVMDIGELDAFIDEAFPQAKRYGMSVKELSDGTIGVLMNAGEEDLRPGNTVSGPTMFALADVSAYLLILAHIGKVALAVTTSLNINFMAKPSKGDLHATGRLLKLGKRLAVCEIHIYSADDVMVAQATATYSIPPQKQSAQ